MSGELNWVAELVRLVSTAGAAAFGAWLSISFFPLRAQHKKWVWEKRTEAQEFIFEALSEIAFVAHNYLNSEYADGFSMTRLSGADTEETIFRRVRELHERSAGLGLLLNKEQNEILEAFLAESQAALDHAKETWGQWHQPEEDIKAEQHTDETIASIGKIAADAVKQLKKVIKPIYE